MQNEFLLLLQAVPYLAGFCTFWFLISRYLVRRRLSSVRMVPLAAGADDFDALLSALMGDRRAAIRLIDHEQARFPGMSRADAVSRALDKLRADRNR